MSNVRLVLLTKRPDENGLFPVELIYQIKRKRAYFRTKEKLRAENWNSADQIAVYINKKKAGELLPGVDFNSLPGSREIDAINNRHGAIKEDIAAIEDRYRIDKVVPSPKIVIAELKKKRAFTEMAEPAPTNQVFDFIDKYIADNKDSREKGSMSVYKALKNHLQGYQVSRNKKVTFDRIDYSFFLDFQNYLINTRTERAPEGLGNVTIAKQLSTLKTFLNYARMHGYEVSNKYKDFTIKKENLEVIALTNDEFETLYNLDLTDNKKLAQVRDVFCFSCATGLRYSDLYQLKREHVKKQEIKITVTKTKQQLTIPLNPYSFSILSKYSEMLRPLPVISNAKMNLYLKELCKKAKITDPVQIVRFRGTKRQETVYPKHDLVTVHTGRKTFCTLSLEKGMSAEQVMKISGHKDYASFSRYVKVTEQLTKTVMRTAWGEIKVPVMKAV